MKNDTKMKLTIFDPVDLAGVIGHILYNISLVAGSVILMIHFNNWWPMFLMLFASSIKYKSPIDKMKDKQDEKE